MTQGHADTATGTATPARDTAPMDAFQRNGVRVAMGCVMFLTGTYVGVDWAGLHYGFTSSYSAGAGYARTVLCALMVALIGQAALGRLDIGLLRAAFGVTLIADYFLILRDATIPGTVLFLGVHGILVYRHAQGLRASWEPVERARTIRLSLITGLVVYGASATLFALFHDVMARTHVLALDAVYLTVLSTSLWMAWGTLIRRVFPARNAWFVVIGMTCFYCCDLTVGIGAALRAKPDTSWYGQVLNNVVGFFYSPALVMLAYSGYRWQRGEGPAMNAQPALQGGSPAMS
jgi:hypothetical protein